MISKLFSFLFKTRCCVCSKPCVKTGEILCENCVKEFEFYTEFEQEVFEGVSFFNILKYNDFARSVIKKLKFQYKKDVSKTLARIMAENFKKEGVFLVIPIPAHKARLRKYGFNHTESICKEFCKITGFKMNTKILYKTRETLVQHFLGREDRLKNIKDSFGVNLKTYKGEKLLIFDDITTTGATLREIVKTFKQVGIEDLVCFGLFK